MLNGEVTWIKPIEIAIEIPEGDHKLALIIGFDVVNGTPAKARCCSGVLPEAPEALSVKPIKAIHGADPQEAIFANVEAVDVAGAESIVYREILDSKWLGGKPPCQEKNSDVQQVLTHGAKITRGVGVVFWRQVSCGT